MSIIEPLVPGEYTALGNMNIRASMNTLNVFNLVGGYRNGEPFTVYEVYPEKNGIVWGRVSSNTGGGSSRYTALRVNNHPKAKLVEESPDAPSWQEAIDAWARSKGFVGPAPY